MRFNLRRAVMVLLCALSFGSLRAAVLGPAEPINACTFSPGGWNRSDWIPARNPRSDHFGGWLQQADCIVNETPAGATPEELQGKRSAECDASMVYRQKVTGNFTITSTMAFSHKMALLIVGEPR